MKPISQLCLVCFVFAVLGCSSRVKSSPDVLNDDEFPAEMVSFVPFRGNPVFQGTGTGTWDRKIRERGYILYEDSLYKMWYTGYNPDFAEQKFLGYATSKDGVNWTKYSEGPVYKDRWTEDVFVIKNKGIYYMFAEGKNDIAHMLASADGINWQDQGDLILITTKGDTISGPYGTPTAWAEKGKWYLFYERNDSAVWLATSNNLLTWTNIQDEPVLKAGPEKYDAAAVAADQLVKFEGRYFMYYHATDRKDWQHPSSHVVWTSAVAMSDDLIHWVKYSGNPFVGGDHSSPLLVFDRPKPSLYTVHSEVCRYLPE